MIWTEEADALLIKLWDEGGTLTKVADGMAASGYNVSRSAISGRRSRIGRARFARQYHREQTMTEPRVRNRRAPIGVAPIEPDLPPPPVMRCEGVNYLDNPEDGCKAILDVIGTDGLRMVCGMLRGNDWAGSRSPYCRKHYKLFHNPPTPQRKTYGESSQASRS
jgi:hypothetical protein